MVTAPTLPPFAFMRGVSAEIGSLLAPSPVMEQALAEFGLMSAFRAISPEHQRDYIRWVDSSPSEAIKRDRIADVLDELCVGSAVYSPRTWGRW